jgi:diaminopimelate decarboxylase
MTLLDHLPSLQRAATPRIDPAIWPLTAGVDDLVASASRCAVDGHADEFHHPAYVLDESDFRHRLTRAATTLQTPKPSMRQGAADNDRRTGWPGRVGVDVSSGGSWRPRSRAASIRRE